MSHRIFTALTALSRPSGCKRRFAHGLTFTYAGRVDLSTSVMAVASGLPGNGFPARALRSATLQCTRFVSGPTAPG